MKLRSIFITLVILCVITALGALFPKRAVEASAPPPEAAPFSPGELLVRFNDDVLTSSTARTLARYRASQVRTLLDGEVQLWQVPEGQELEVAKALSADPGVVYAEPNYRYHALTTPDDPHYSKQWAHSIMNSPTAWDMTTGSTSITIAIIDTGIDESHPDLAGKIVAGKDYIDEDTNPHDLNGHGTHVAGIAAAVGNNATGVAGLSWGARIMPVRVLNAVGNGEISDIVEGITWAYQNGADIINLSLGGSEDSQSLQDAISDAHSAGTLVVAAMGNCRYYDPGNHCYSANPTSYPAANEHVFAVAATGPTDSYASYSQYGSHCDIAAPGGDMSYLHDPDGIYSTMPTYAVDMNTTYGYSQGYDYVNGTSQATPYVAGLAALVWSQAPGLTPDQVQAIIENSAVDLGSSGWDTNYGHGRIDAAAAVAAALPPDPPQLYAINNPSQADAYTVSWSAISGASSYILEEADNAAFSDATVRYMGTATSYGVTGQPNGAWYYRVQAVKYVVSSDWSDARSTSVAAASLGAPTLDAISNPENDGNYQVSWSAVTSATGYTLEESQGPYFEAPTVAYTGSATGLSVTEHAGGEWYYRVRATASTGNGPWSEARPVTVRNTIFLPLVYRYHRSSGSLANGTFEEGATGWLEYSSNGWPLILYRGDLYVSPHGGDWAVWLGGDLNEDSYIQQQVTVPAGAPYLAYWHWIISEDYCNFDYGGVAVNGINAESYTLCESANTGGWVKRVVNLSAYAGQSVSLRIWADTDDTLNSNLFIDDVAFQATTSMERAPLPATNPGIPYKSQR